MEETAVSAMGFQVIEMEASGGEGRVVCVFLLLPHTGQIETKF